jgi:ABC-type histidine transport system ATPase subunit
LLHCINLLETYQQDAGTARRQCDAVRRGDLGADPELVGEVLAAMQQLARDGMTMVVVTHEMSFARDVADRIVFMEGGVIVEEGKPDQMFSAPRTERVRQFLKRYNDRYRI